MTRVCLALACALAVGEAFQPLSTTFQSLSRAAVARKMSDGNNDGVVRLSEIENERTAANKPKAYKLLDAENEGVNQEGLINPEGDYTGLVDGDSFDGGDGQVGVVGDGTNAMETFTQTGVGGGGMTARGQSFGGSESKLTAKNAFGSTTGYAEELEEKGMTDVDEYGEDKLQARRQQLENWQNQRQLKERQNQELAELTKRTGFKYDPRAGSATYMDRLNEGEEDESQWNVYKGIEGPDKLTEALQGVAAGPELTATIEMACNFPAPAFHQIMVENDVISFEDFTVGFAAGWDTESFQVTPASGTLNRRGGDPTPLQVVFKPTAPGGVRETYVVVETEESKWTYRLIGQVM